MKSLLRPLLWLIFFAIVALIIGAGVAAYWAFQRPVPMKPSVIDYLVEGGSAPQHIARTLIDAGVDVRPALGFVWLARLSGRDKQLKAGAYEARAGDTPWDVLERMANGDMAHARLTFPEGRTVAQMRAALDADPDVRHDSQGLTEADLITRLELSGNALEGRFYPDTYVFAPGSSDLDILRRAALAGTQILTEAWEERDPDLPLANPYEALILASIIEKETGHGEDRARIAGVFINRLRMGMPLQTDPTVIYGMGAEYEGRLRKKDLTRDTPWNTYTRTGLPPTPIANPGKAALLAAVHPEAHNYLYFVSRGDGSSEFSATLGQHNRAVGRYILKRASPH